MGMEVVGGNKRENLKLKFLDKARFGGVTEEVRDIYSEWLGLCLEEADKQPGMGVRLSAEIDGVEALLQVGEDKDLLLQDLESYRSVSEQEGLADVTYRIDSLVASLNN